MAETVTDVIMIEAKSHKATRSFKVFDILDVSRWKIKRIGKLWLAVHDRCITERLVPQLTGLTGRITTDMLNGVFHSANHTRRVVEVVESLHDVNFSMAQTPLFLCYTIWTNDVITACSFGLIRTRKKIKLINYSSNNNKIRWLRDVVDARATCAIEMWKEVDGVSRSSIIVDG